MDRLIVMYFLSLDMSASGRLAPSVIAAAAEKLAARAPEGRAPEGDGEGGSQTVQGFNPTCAYA